MDKRKKPIRDRIATYGHQPTGKQPSYDEVRKFLEKTFKPKSSSTSKPSSTSNTK